MRVRASHVVRASRLPVRLHGKLKLDASEVPCIVRDVSVGGALLEVPSETRTLGIGVAVHCDVEPSGGRAPFSFSARVRSLAEGRNQRGQGCLHVGVALDELDEPSAEALKHLLMLQRPTLLIVGESKETWEVLAEHLQPIAQALFVERAEDVPAAFEAHEVCGIVCGPRMSDAEAVDLLSTVTRTFPNHPGAHVVLCARNPGLFQELVEGDHVFYLAPKPIPLSECAAILEAAIQRYQSRVSPRGSVLNTSPAAAARISAVIDGLAKGVTLEGVVGAIESALRDLLGCDRAYCHAYEPREGLLWSDRPGSQRRTASAVTGIAGFVARTGLGVQAQSAVGDARFDREADDPDGEDDARLLIEPVLTGPGQVVAVLVAARNASREMFSQTEHQLMQVLAVQLAPSLAQFFLREEIDEALGRESAKLGGFQADDFRAEALRHHSKAGLSEGALLQVAPSWMRWLFRVIVLLAMASVAFLVLDRVPEHVSGPAFIRMEGLTRIPSDASGLVTKIEVAQGNRVRRGDLLLILDTGGMAPALQRVFAPRGGVVSDVRVRPNQVVSVGEVILTIRDEAPSFFVWALMPGSHRPKLRSGEVLSFELSGYAHSPQELRIEAVSDVLYGPGELRRLLGPDAPEAWIPREPTALVTARLSTTTFVLEGETVPLFDGMTGTASIRVRTEPLLFLVAPGLKNLGRYVSW